MNHHKRTLTPVEIVYNAFGFTMAAIIGVTVAYYGRKAMQEFEIREAADKLELEDQSRQSGGHVSESVEVRHELKRSAGFRMDAALQPGVSGIDRSASLKETTVEVQPTVDSTADRRNVSGELTGEVATATSTA